MRKKNYSPNSDHEENEFDVDEPEEIQNNASDDDWTPEKDTSGGRRTSNRLRNIPKSRAPIIDASSSDEEEDGSDSGAGNKRKGKGRGRGRQPAKKHKVSSTSSTPAKVKTENDMGGTKSVISDSEPSSTTANNTASSVTITPNIVKVNKDFTSGAFIVLKSDVAKLDEDPPLWKIDGKALLQKYVAFEQDGQTLYKNTSVYSGWTINNKDNYYPVSVIFKQQTRKDHIIEFKRDQIKMEEIEHEGRETDNGNDNMKDDEEDEEDDEDENEEEEEEENEDDEEKDEEDDDEDKEEEDEINNENNSGKENKHEEKNGKEPIEDEKTSNKEQEEDKE